MNWHHASTKESDKAIVRGPRNNQTYFIYNIQHTLVHVSSIKLICCLTHMTTWYLITNTDISTSDGKKKQTVKKIYK